MSRMHRALRSFIASTRRLGRHPADGRIGPTRLTVRADWRLHLGAPTQPPVTAADVFHVTGFTAQQISDGAMSRMMNLWSGNLRHMEELRRRFGSLGSAAAAGVLARELVEIYGLPSSGAEGDVNLRERYGTDYQSVEFLNDAALRLCQELKIDLPPLIGRTTRAELPPHLELIVQFPTCRIAGRP